MPLAIHLGIHFALAVLSGYLLGAYFNNKKLGVIFGILGGFLIDLDHVLEYFLVFGPSFNLQYFFESRQFLASDMVRIYFHAWEYLPLLLIFAFVFRKKDKIKIALITLALAGSIHLVSDVLINDSYFKYYSLSYRASHNFSAKDLIPEEQYEQNMILKDKLGIESIN